VRDRGAAGERAAAKALRRAGYKILERNVRTPSGEIDIVAREGDLLCIVEVKARTGRRHGSPEEGLTPTKIRRLRAAAAEMLRSRGLAGHPHRFDLVAVDLSEEGDPIAVRLHRGVLS
jgi:putative endonuclease